MEHSIFSQTSEELMTLLKSWGEPAFRANQVKDWIFEKRVTSIKDMTNLPHALKQKLAETFADELPKIVERLDDDSGTTKILLDGKGKIYEAVIMRYEERTSLCVSSQVGCKLACSFCQTGKLGFFRHLTTAEIMGQFYIANDIVKSEGRKITNIVFMGMGEPLDNFDNVIHTVKLLTDPTNHGISARKVTVSTSGLADRIRQLAHMPLRFKLAVSLHACRDELRTKLMPINRKFSLAELKDSLLEYQKVTGDLITIEYILIENVNSSILHAKDLVRFIHGLRAKVNLIPFNAHPGMEYQRPEDDAIRAFQVHLAQRNIPAPVRYSKGTEVSGACGQLAAKKLQNLELAPKRKDALLT